MKNRIFWKIVVVVWLSLLTIGADGFIFIFTAQGTPLQSDPVTAGYLVDEMFSQLSFNWVDRSQLKISDWQVDSRAGDITNTYWNYLALTDTSTEFGLELRKRFLPQTSGSIIVEFAFSGSAQDGRVFSIRSSGDIDAVKFMVSGGDFGYKNSGGNFTSLLACVSNMTVRAVVHPASGTFDIDVNGTRYGTSLDFTAPTSDIGEFFIGTSPTGTDSFQMKYLVVLKGYTVYQRFTNATAGQVPSGWYANTGSGISAVPEWGGATMMKDTLNFKLQDTSTTNNAVLVGWFTNSVVTNKSVWEFKFIQSTKMNGAGMFLRNGSTIASKLNTFNGDITYTKPGGAVITLWPDYRTNVWYTVRVIADPVADEADIFINGKSCTNVSLTESVSSFDNIAFTTQSSGTGTMWIDDIYLYQYTNVLVASDYVPSPVVVTNSTIAVGMQTFFAGWRPGHGAGWDCPYRFPNHDPYLGFFDEGSSESMDWQLLWMCDAGVNFFMDCWYIYSQGAPIKEPLFEYTQGALHEGYFYSKYSDLVKFAISDWSTKETSSENFRKYVIPYWIEYYFQDPRYMTIDNKPVIGFGKVKDWIGLLGTNAVKADMDYLRDQLVSIGYDGAICIACYKDWEDTPNDLKMLRDAGMDGCYAYNFSSNGLTYMQDAITTARTNSPAGFAPVATCYLGNNGEAWNLPNYGLITATNFGSMAEWIRDEYIPAVSTNLPGHKMMLFGNWNEYGEGSFIAPTKLTGFDYLSQIRNVFAASGSGSYPTNFVPATNQLARINTLYSRGRTGRFWGFDSLYPDAEGWAIGNCIAGLVQSNGFLTGTITGNDPSLQSLDGYDIPAADNPNVIVRMKNMSTGTAARIYFATGTSQSFDQSKSKQFTITTNEIYQTYVIDMSTNAYWTGNLTKLRLDPMDSGATAGSFSIDYIEIGKWTSSAWGFDSNTEGWTAEYGITGLVQSNGFLNGTIINNDPVLRSWRGYVIPATTHSNVVVRMKNMSAGTSARIYFITDTHPTWAQSQSKSFTIIPSDTTYQTYDIDMSTNTNWDGNVVQLRLDPMDSSSVYSGSFSIDYIEIR